MTVTTEQVLDELAYLATVEHALVVDYLLVHYALRTLAAPAPGVAGAIEEALSMSQNAEMHHLARVNRVLVDAGRPPVMDRAAHVVTPSGAISVAALQPGRFDGFPRREKAVAAALDQRYARLAQEVEASGDVLDPDFAGQLSFVLATVAGHAGDVDTLAGHLQGVDLSDLIDDIRLDPADDLERDVLSLADGYYRTVVATVEASFAHDAALGGELLSIAITTMDHLHRVNGVLVERGLVPAFDLRRS